MSASAFLASASGVTSATVVESPLLPLRAGFCSHKDSEGHVVYDHEYFAYLWDLWKVQGDDAAGRLLNQTIDIKRAAGMTFASAVCPDSGAYFADGHNWIKRTPNWLDAPSEQYFPMLRYLQSRGLNPVAYLFGGGANDQPKIYQSASQHGSLRWWVRAFKDAGLLDRTWLLWAWESFGVNGDDGRAENTAKQNCDAWQAMWDEGCRHIAGHVQPGFRLTFYPKPWEDDSPVPESDTGEIEAWFVPGGDKVGNFFSQYQPRVDKAELQQQVREHLDRLLPTGAPLPYLKDAKAEHAAGGPDWMGRPRAAGRMVYTAWEPGVPVKYIRGEMSDAEVRENYETLKGVGVEHFGCMPA